MDCTVADNAGDVALRSSSALNSIIYGDTSVGPIELPGGSIGPFWISSHGGNTMSFCCIYPDGEAVGGRNLTNNPVFVNAAHGDYRLAAGSPCLDRGTNQPWMAGATDLAGHPRLINGTVDIGAYEGAVPVLQPSVVRSNGVVHVRLQTMPGFLYTLEAKDTLSDPTWRTVTALSGNGSVLDLPDTQAASGQRFYRVRQEWPPNGQRA